MALPLFVNIAAESLDRALVRSEIDLTPVDLGQLIIGESKEYLLKFVDGLGGFVSWSGNGAYVPEIAIGECGYPSGGTFTLTFGANTTSALAYNASPAAVQAALEALPSIGSGNVSVTGVAGKYYIVEFIASKGGASQAEITAAFGSLTPAGTVEVSTLVEGSASPVTNEQQLLNLALNPLTYADDWTPVDNGYQGRLSFRTLELLEKFAVSGPTLSEVFQVTVLDPDGNPTTFCKIDCSIQCTIINPASFAGADKPNLVTQAQLAAAVLGATAFSREALSSSGAGNTSITRPSGSHHHAALVAVTGVAGTRKLIALTSNSPVAGDTILLQVLPDDTVGNVLEVRNATSGGTLLKSITTDDSEQPYFLILGYSGSAWQVEFNDADILRPAGNLAGLANVRTARANMRSLLSRVDSATADFTVDETGDDGKLFLISAASAAVEITLPAAATAGLGFAIGLQKTDGVANVVTTDPATRTLSSAGQTVILLSDGTQWIVVMDYDPGAAPVTESDVILNRFDITGLTGGSSADLDGIATASGAIATNSVLLLAYGTPRAATLWQLVAGVDAEDADAGIVRPDDFDGSTNPYVWKRVL